MPTTVEETEKAETSENKKDELLLDSLEIKGYRCFEHLRIEKLGRVNLIVGKNNVGKTALLEALKLYISPNPDILFDNLLARNESIKIPSNASIEPYIKFTRHLFSNRPSLLFDEDSARFEIDSPKLGKIFVDSYPPNSSFNYPRFQVKGVDKRSEIKNYFIGVNGIDSNETSSLWDNITLTELQEPTISILRIISPKIIDINFIVYPKGANIRIPLAKIEKVSEPIPPSQFG
jgi:AAA ATPase domain